jgi:S1-C subfamily serine protease
MAPVVVGSADGRWAVAGLAGRLACTNIAAEKQQSAKAAIQRLPLGTDRSLGHTRDGGGRKLELFPVR